MAYESYAADAYYSSEYKGSLIPPDELSKWLRNASRHIDALTYNRIVGRGFSNLTVFQQDIIREAVCAQAEFEYQNKEIFDMILQGYSINGVSMQFGDSWNVMIRQGIPMRRDNYELLSQTGLCCRVMG